MRFSMAFETVAMVQPIFCFTQQFTNIWQEWPIPTFWQGDEQMTSPQNPSDLGISRGFQGDLTHAKRENHGTYPQEVELPSRRALPKWYGEHHGIADATANKRVHCMTFIPCSDCICFGDGLSCNHPIAFLQFLRVTLSFWWIALLSVSIYRF